jgi:1-acyl-sn-glycerol-3-phosphate acyltransferase
VADVPLIWQGLARVLIGGSTAALTARTALGASHLPREGGVIVAANHISEFDPLVLAQFILDAGRWPRFLAKASLFEVPLLGGLLHRFDQIPVQRGSANAAAALDKAAQALEAGDVVVIYPEGTTPKTGDLWPGPGRTGLARLFLATGAPVIPVVTWGVQHVFDPRSRRWQLYPRAPVTVCAGPALDLVSWNGAAAGQLDAITARVMSSLRDLLVELRGSAPALASDHRTSIAACR